MPPPTPLVFHFADDGLVPNNRLPLLIYRGAFELADLRDPEAIIERVFRENGWGREMWRNGIYPFTHFHSMIHEALGVARGRARVRFGGEAGATLELIAGDVAVLPAGTGHQALWTSPDLSVIGSYPPGGTYNLCRAGGAEHAAAVKVIPHVPLPTSDPVRGRKGPLTALWRA
ncbi:MAG: hypothetical protein IRY89_03630 [Pseudolabrys sp.]|nr:hypothetical protein [Pseudolabrys sp.]